MEQKVNKKYKVKEEPTQKQYLNQGQGQSQNRLNNQENQQSRRPKIKESINENQNKLNKPDQDEVIQNPNQCNDDKEKQNEEEDGQEQTKQQDPVVNAKKQRKQRIYQKPIVNVNQKLIQNMFVHAQISKSLLLDLSHDFKNPLNRRPFKELMDKVLADKQKLIKSAYNSHEIIKKTTGYQINIPREILQRYMNILIEQKQVIKKQLYYKQADKMYGKVPTKYLVSFILLYDIPIKDQQQLRDIIHELSQNKLIEDAFRLIRSVKMNINIQKQEKRLLQKLVDSKNYRQLKRILKQFKISQKIVKQLRAQMLNRTANYYLHGQSWQYLQEIFEPYPQIIAQVINRACQNLKKFKKNNNLQGATSICLRNQKVFKKLNKLAKSIIEDELQYMNKQKGLELKNNLMIHQFKPSDQTYFSFQQFNLAQEHIYWVDSNTPESMLKQVRKKIQTASYIGIDTESTLARTPIDTDEEILALIQVSTYHEVFLFDPYKINHPEIYECFKTYFEDKDKKIVGHTIKDDIQLVSKILKFKKKPDCTVIDIKDQVVKMKVDCKHGLKHISHHYLGKQICKKYTLTNWQRRPLNKNQIHYAAMDAFIVLKIWQKILAEKTSKKIQQKQNQVQNQRQKSLSKEQLQQKMILKEKQQKKQQNQLK